MVFLSASCVALKVEKAHEGRPVLLSPELVGQTVSKEDDTWYNRQRRRMVWREKEESLKLLIQDTGIAVEVLPAQHLHSFCPFFLSYFSDLSCVPFPVSARGWEVSLTPLPLHPPLPVHPVN